jgi:ABC-type transport system substrate-binding protein
MFTEAEAKAAHKHDLNEAKRLLAEAGYADGVTLELPTDDARSQSEITLYALLQAQLKKAGINLDSTNNAKINDPELDRLLDGQRREMNPEKRRDLLRAAVTRIHDQVWYISLFYPPNYDMVQSYVKGYHPHFSVAPYLYVWIQK